MKKNKNKILGKRMMPQYLKHLNEALKNCNTVIDVGCGRFSPLQLIDKEIYSIGIDGFDKSLRASKKNNIHNEYRKMNVLDLGKKFQEDSVDCVIAIDLIEHLEKEEGNQLLKAMDKIAKKYVIIYTPNGFLEQGVYDNNPAQLHKSGWEVKEMEKKGFKVYGDNGWKKLRKEKAALRYWPSFFWEFISRFSQKFVEEKPEKAFQIFCVKKLKK